MDKYRVVIVTDKGEIEGKNCATRDEVDDFILNKEGVKTYRIKDLETKKIIETDKGKING